MTTNFLIGAVIVGAFIGLALFWRDWTAAWIRRQRRAKKGGCQ